jgi:hypothetical protein
MPVSKLRALTGRAKGFILAQEGPSFISRPRPC